MKALHTYTTITRQPKQNAKPCADNSGCGGKNGGENREVTIQASQRKEKIRIEIVPVRVVVRFSHPRSRIRSKDALNASALCPSPIPSPRSAHLRDTPRPVLLRAFRDARRERYMRTWLLPLPTLCAARRFGVRDDRGLECGRRGRFEWCMW